LQTAIGTITTPHTYGSKFIREFRVKSVNSVELSPSIFA